MKKGFVLLLGAVVLMSVVFTLWGCDALKEKAKDEATKDVDKSFDEEKSFELDPITVDETSNDPVPQGASCGTTSVNKELVKAGIDLDEVDISGITLIYVKAMYSDATWDPNPPAEITCTLIFGGATGGSATVAETAVNGSGSEWNDIDVSDAAIAVVNYYLTNRGEDFSYCLTCTGEVDTYSVTYYVEIGVRVEGEAVV